MKQKKKKEERNVRRRTLRFLFSPPTDRPTDRPSVRSLVRFLFPPFYPVFLIRAIFPGRSHVNFQRPMTQQTRGAQTSMIFRVFRVQVESKIPNRLDAQPIPPSLRLLAIAPSPHPSLFPFFSSISIRGSVVPYRGDMCVIICNMCEETRRDGINEGYTINEGSAKQSRKGFLIAEHYGVL